MPNILKHGQIRDDSERTLYLCFIFFAAALFCAAFFFNSPEEILLGNIVILTSAANLITDYFHIANIGATLVNASIMVLQAIVIIKISKVQVNGLVVASIFTISGFSLFGKNIYNATPIILGVMVYAKISRTPFRTLVPIALFGTALAPLVSEVTFNFGLPVHRGILFGVLAGFLSGFVMPLLAKHFYGFHKGFSLYNMGFTAGIIGTFCIALFRSFGVEVAPVYLVSGGNNKPLAIFVFSLFAVMLLVGLCFTRLSLKDYMKLLRESGRGCADFISEYGIGLVFINMSVLGIISTLYILIVGGELNGPTIGGILTVAGFGASGKHPFNVIPILTGVFLIGYFSIHDINSTSALLAALFGTTLAPLSGYYGILPGVIAGGIHIIFTTNLTFLHAGMNLYNNGYSGGFVAALMVPILDEIFKKSNKNSDRLDE